MDRARIQILWPGESGEVDFNKKKQLSHNETAAFMLHMNDIKVNKYCKNDSDNNVKIYCPEYNAEY